MREWSFLEMVRYGGAFMFLVGFVYGVIFGVLVL